MWARLRMRRSWSCAGTWWGPRWGPPHLPPRPPPPPLGRPLARHHMDGALCCPRRLLGPVQHRERGRACCGGGHGRKVKILFPSQARRVEVWFRQRLLDAPPSSCRRLAFGARAMVLQILHSRNCKWLCLLCIGLFHRCCNLHGHGGSFGSTVPSLLRASSVVESDRSPFQTPVAPHPEFLRVLWNFSHADRDYPAIFDPYRTGEVRHGYCGTDDEATEIQKAIFLSCPAAFRMLGYTWELEIKHHHRSLPSTHAHYNSYSFASSSVEPPRAVYLVCVFRPLW